jgi:hypothetical protein
MCTACAPKKASILAQRHKRSGLPCSSQGYQVVLGVKGGARVDPRGLRQTLDASAAIWT